MPRIRNIKPDYWTDEKVVELGPWERLLFIGLWNFADDEGYMPYSPKRIKMQVFPADALDVSVLVQNLLEASLIDLYDYESGLVLHIRHWKRHQKVSNPTPTKIDKSQLSIRPVKPRNQAEVAQRPVIDPLPSTENSVPLRTEREREREWEGGSLVTLRTDASPARTSKNAAHRIVQAWVDANEKKPPAKIVLDATAQIQAMVNEGIDPEDIANGVREWWDGKYPASTLPNYVARAQQGAKVQMSTGSQRAMVGIELARKFAEEESQDEPF